MYNRRELEESPGRRLEFRVLGPLEVRAGGSVLQLGGTRQRAVLALLLTHANEIVSSDRLIDGLWAGELPASATNTLQGYISHLRKALGEDVIETRAPGYGIRVGPGELDLDRFEQAVERGRGQLDAGETGAAAHTLREALALWRGKALADFAFESFAQGEIARLEELRLAALEKRIDAELALGRESELVGELERLVVEHPLRERVRGQLMLALYRSGRQTEALAAYQDARASLVDELGLDPGPALQELERAMLRQDPALGRDSASTNAIAATPPTASRLEAGSILVVVSERQSLEPLHALAERLARAPRRELIVARLLRDDSELQEESAALDGLAAELRGRGVEIRAAAFTSTGLADDIVLLGSEQEADLLLLVAPPELLESGVPDVELASVLAEMPCDVGLLFSREQPLPIDAEHPVLVPFGGAEHEWAAVELGAWIARAHGARLRLVGTRADPDGGRRDASRLLARAALMVQRVAAVPTEPELVERGEVAVVGAAASAGLVVVGLSARWRQEGLGRDRLAVLRDSLPQTLLVRRGLRPGGLAPARSVTRFTWTLAREGD